MFSLVDKLILTGLGIELGVIALVVVRGKGRTRWGKTVLVLFAAALVATLVPAAERATAHWRLRAVKAFVRTSIEELNAGRLPELSDRCPDAVREDIEKLRGASLPTAYTVEKVGFAGGYYALDLRAENGAAFWCMVQATAPSNKPWAPGTYRLLELAPPSTNTSNRQPATDN